MKDIAGFMLDLRKELTVGDHGLLYILKFGANVCSIDNFEQNWIHIFIVYCKRGLKVLWYTILGQFGFNAL